VLPILAVANRCAYRSLSQRSALPDRLLLARPGGRAARERSAANPIAPGPASTANVGSAMGGHFGGRKRAHPPAGMNTATMNTAMNRGLFGSIPNTARV
jgi:hypothetical protein